MITFLRRVFRVLPRRIRAILSLPGTVGDLQRQIDELRRENDQLRRDSLRTAELADLVVEKLSEDQRR